MWKSLCRVPRPTRGFIFVHELCINYQMLVSHDFFAFVFCNFCCDCRCYCCWCLCACLLVWGLFFRMCLSFRILFIIRASLAVRYPFDRRWCCCSRWRWSRHWKPFFDKLTFIMWKYLKIFFLPKNIKLVAVTKKICFVAFL